MDRGAYSLWNQKKSDMTGTDAPHNNKNNGKQVKETVPTWSQNWLPPSNTNAGKNPLEKMEYPS